MNDIKRVILHWTAGGNRASDLDKAHYHRLVEYDGTIIAGTEAIADNIVTSDGDYAAHTLNLNTGSIGVGLCGMREAIESPFTEGPSPLTEKQFRAGCILIADLCREYSIPVTERTVLTHAEVQHTLGVKQRGKWDISRLPFKPELRGAKAVGDYMRELVSEAIGRMPLRLSIQHTEGRYTLKRGMKGPLVGVLQRSLNALQFFAGNPDNDFGTRTDGAVRQLQTERGLDVDGVVGPATWAAIDEGTPNERKQINAAELIERGSTTMAAVEKGKATVRGLGIAGTIATVKMAADGAQEGLTSVSGVLEVGNVLVVSYWPVLAVGAVALLAGWWFMHKIGEDRLKDHNSGAHVGR